MARVCDGRGIDVDGASTAGLLVMIERPYISGSGGRCPMFLQRLPIRPVHAGRTLTAEGPAGFVPRDQIRSIGR